MSSVDVGDYGNNALDLVANAVGALGGCSTSSGVSARPH